MPVKAASLLDELGVHPKRRSLSWAQWGADFAYGKRAPSRRPRFYAFPKMPWMDKLADAGGYKEKKKAAEAATEESMRPTEEQQVKAVSS